MGKTKNPITPYERERIQVGRALKQNIRQIAKSIGRSPSTVSRELAQNRSTEAETSYSSNKAQYTLECNSAKDLEDILNQFREC